VPWGKNRRTSGRKPQATAAIATVRGWAKSCVSRKLACRSGPQSPRGECQGRLKYQRVNAHREAAQFNEIVSGRPSSACERPLRAPARRIQLSSFYGSYVQCVPSFDSRRVGHAPRPVGVSSGSTRLAEKRLLTACPDVIYQLKEPSWPALACARLSGIPRCTGFQNLGHERP